MRDLLIRPEEVDEETQYVSKRFPKPCAQFDSWRGHNAMIAPRHANDLAGGDRTISSSGRSSPSWNASGPKSSRPAYPAARAP